MLVDMRIYTTAPGKMPEFLALYESKAWPLQLKYLENCLGYYTTVEGALNTLVHLWGYADQGDRERRRAAMAADPAWAAYLAEGAARGLLVKQENRFVRPTGFFTAYQAQKKAG